MAITKTYDLLNINGVKGWVRDSWARRAIAALQQRVAGIVVPTKTSELTNDSGYITSADVPPGSTASSTTPLMDGTGAAGSSADYARADHVHPSDAAKQDVLTTAQLEAVNSGITAAKVAGYDGLIDFFGTPESIPSGSDLNTYMTPGHFSANSNAIASTLTNSPTTINFTLFVIYRTSSLISQIIIGSSNSIFMRHKTSTAWGSWYKITGTTV